MNKTILISKSEFRKKLADLVVKDQLKIGYLIQILSKLYLQEF